MKNWAILKTITMYATVKYISDTFYVFAGNDIDKNGVITMLKNAGFEITSLGFGRYGHFNKNHKLEIIITN
jgi:methanogenic corrinoid protein MtbC1